MKNIIFISFAVSLTVIAFGQKPEKGNFGFVAGLSGIPGLNVNTSNNPTSSIGLRYKPTERGTVRGGFRYGNNKTTTKSDTTGIGFDTTTTRRNWIWMISLGYQHALGKIKRLEPYVGTEVVYGVHNGSVNTKVTAVSAATSTVTAGDYMETKINNAGKGKVLGLHSFVGFDYFIADHLALGAEFGYTIGVANMSNGTTSITKTGSTFGASGTSYVNNSASEKQNIMDVDGGKGMITVSVYF